MHYSFLLELSNKKMIRNQQCTLAAAMLTVWPKIYTCMYKMYTNVYPHCVIKVLKNHYTCHCFWYLLSQTIKARILIKNIFNSFV